MKNLFKRLIMYFGGLFILALGVAVSVKSNFGVSPVSSIPYTVTCVWGFDMGIATVVYYTVLVILELLILRKDFKPIYFLQIFAGLIYGSFTTLTNNCMALIPIPDNMVFRIIELIVSIGLISTALFLYVPANIIQNPPEGAIQAIAKKTKNDFPKIKIFYDITAVLISLITCLIFTGKIESVGIGTIADALLVGTVLKFMTKLWGAKRDAFLNK